MLVELTTIKKLEDVHLVQQEGRFKILNGLGIPELFHIGLQYEGRVNQFGISAGSGYSEEFITINAHAFFHFKRREDGSLNRWYLKTGLSYNKEEDGRKT
jgi:hypothetical protein